MKSGERALAARIPAAQPRVCVNKPPPAAETATSPAPRER